MTTPRLWTGRILSSGLHPPTKLRGESLAFAEHLLRASPSRTITLQGGHSYLCFVGQGSETRGDRACVLQATGSETGGVGCPGHQSPRWRCPGRRGLLQAERPPISAASPLPLPPTWGELGGEGFQRGVGLAKEGGRRKETCSYELWSGFRRGVWAGLRALCSSPGWGPCRLRRAPGGGGPRRGPQQGGGGRPASDQGGTRGCGKLLFPRESSSSSMCWPCRKEILTL